MLATTQGGRVTREILAERAIDSKTVINNAVVLVATTLQEM